ncbi:MAG TPA: hypothetical protein VLC51_11660 [Nitrospira sp.]|nr:hypothetical protein [Nitrospira sp.]
MTVLSVDAYAGSGERTRETSPTAIPTTTMEEFSPVAESNKQALLSGDRVVIGTVETIASDQIEVKYPESLQLRYLPLSQAREKGMTINKGDKIEMVFNAQDVLVDFHPVGHVEGQHEVIRGSIDQQMSVGQEHVVIKTANGKTVTYPVRPLARSKMASMPVGVDAVFLADESGKIVDVTFGSADAVTQASQEYQRMSNPTAPHSRIEGMVLDPTAENAITIETSDGKTRTYPVRPFLREQASGFKTGERLTLLIDSDNHVIDVAQTQR